MKVIAEIGCNHAGDIETAKKLIKSAKLCGAYCAKFQKRCNRELLTTEQYNAPHPCPENSYGKTYGEHREYLEFTLEQHEELKRFCEDCEIVYSTSVWDKTSAREIISINPEFIKVGSPSNLNFDMQKLLRDEYTGDVHISFGMTTQDEIETIMEFWKGYENRLIVYSCTSDYPVKFDDVCLLHIQELSNKYGHLVKGIGFSGHHLGIAVDIGARVLGANWIERHFTLDRTMKGTDHSASLESAGLQKLIRDLSAIDKALKSRPIGILDCEIPSRQKLKYNSQIS